MNVLLQPQSEFETDLSLFANSITLGDGMTSDFVVAATLDASPTIISGNGILISSAAAGFAPSIAVHANGDPSVNLNLSAFGPNGAVVTTGLELKVNGFGGVGAVLSLNNAANTFEMDFQCPTALAASIRYIWPLAAPVGGTKLTSTAPVGGVCTLTWT